VVICYPSGKYDVVVFGRYHIVSLLVTIIIFLFQGKNESLDQKMLVDNGFKEEGIVSEGVASKFRLSEARIKNMGFGLGMD
jgi:hypothetical protein